ALERVNCSRCPLLYDSPKTQAEVTLLKEKVYCTDEEVTKYTVTIGDNTYQTEAVTKMATNCTILSQNKRS
ncbi:MAG: hypothetical protein IIY09_02875, partial [Clostridia bacterium]|nr:hypothetical protein [Clostridia bacterium]